MPNAIISVGDSIRQKTVLYLIRCYFTNNQLQKTLQPDRAQARQAGRYFDRKDEEMTVEMLKSKIHRAVVTQAELNYVGSITIDEDLMNAAGILE